MKLRRFISRSILPIMAFLVVLGFHFVWIGLFPEKNPAQSQWVSVGAVAQTHWLTRYIEGEHYWMGYVYALSLGFVVVAIRQYTEQRSCNARNFALGGVTFSGFMAVLGCFLVGCCGSPMLGVYLGLFGAKFLPFAKPLVAGISTLLILGSYWWMRRQAGRTSCRCSLADPPGPVLSD